MSRQEKHTWPRVTRLILALIASSFSHFAVAEASGVGTWRFLWANDTLMHSDNQFTNGIAAQKHSALFASLNDTKGTPAFGKRLAAAFLPDSPDLNYREGWAVGQNMQTPEALELDELLPKDVPYVGMLGWTNSYIAFNDRRLTGFDGATSSITIGKYLASLVK
jgi:hypothetical protein